MPEKVKEIIARYTEADPESINGDSKLVEELALTSFDVLVIMSDVEEEFGIIVDEDMLMGIVTVNDVIKRIRELKGEDK
ncbi:MAG: acyl carrier protein [Lachnospiraceae bacterium]|nr:acyl carrier protein [Lachnospiraceae bacterium]